jgi:hypothetical protein
MRIRITFVKQGALRYTGHLDLHKLWERAARRWLATGAADAHAADTGGLLAESLRLAGPRFNDVFRLAEVFIPTAPGTSLQRVIVYSLHGRRRNPLARSLALLLRSVVRGTVRRAERPPVRPHPSMARRSQRVGPHGGARLRLVGDPASRMRRGRV